jgi:hypothetical protein
MAILHALSKTVQLVACGKGHPVVIEGEIGNHMYIMISGCCVVEKSDRVPSHLIQHAAHLSIQDATAPRAAARSCVGGLRLSYFWHCRLRLLLFLCNTIRDANEHTRLLDFCHGVGVVGY